MDKLLLQAFTKKQRYKSLSHVVPQGMVAPDTLTLMAWFDAYYQAFPERDDINIDELQSLVRLRSGGADPTSIALTLHLVEQLRTPPDEVGLNGILGQLYELDLSGRAGALIERYNSGQEVNLAYELQRLSQSAVRAVSQASPQDYVDTSIDELLAEVANDSGLKFRWSQALSQHILGLQGGASVCIAGRPDKGKTSLISRIVTDFAPQVVARYGNTRPILWINNEGSGKRIVPRIYQAALTMDLDEIIALSNKGELIQRYTDAIGGVPDLIRVKDMHGATLAQIEQVIEANNPSVVIGDMIGNFKGGNGGASKAEQIEQLWIEWREIMVRHDVVGLGTIQISVEGDNQPYPPYSALKDSKTGVQGATDVILMLGSLNNPDAANMRWLSSPKNKFAMPKKPSCFQAQVIFDGSKCKFEDGVINITPELPKQPTQEEYSNA